MATDFVFPSITTGAGGYLTTNISQASSQYGDSNSHFNANSLVLANSPSKFYILRNISDQKHYAFWGGSFITNVSTANLLDNSDKAGSLFQADKAGWTNFYNDFYIPVPSLLSDINSSVALAFPIENGYLKLDTPTYTATLSASGKLDSTVWESNNMTYPNYYASIAYDLSWFSSTDSGSGADPSGDTSDYSGIISAITLIPATIIVVCLFKMIFNVFMNRKVRG